MSQIKVINMMDRITIRLPQQQIAMLETLVKGGYYPSLSEAVRYAVREFLKEQGEQAKKDSDQISIEV